MVSICNSTSRQVRSSAVIVSACPASVIQDCSRLRRIDCAALQPPTSCWGKTGWTSSSCATRWPAVQVTFHCDDSGDRGERAPLSGRYPSRRIESRRCSAGALRRSFGRRRAGSAGYGKRRSFGQRKNMALLRECSGGPVHCARACVWFARKNSKWC